VDPFRRTAPSLRSSRPCPRGGLHSRVHDSASGLWAGDLVKDPVRRKPLVLPADYWLDGFDIYGPDIVASIAEPTEQTNVYLISP